MSDLIERQIALNAVDTIGHIATMPDGDKCIRRSAVKYTLSMLPSAQPEYEPVTAEDFAKTMSETSVYSYMLWHSEALTLMKRNGFVICKKTM